MKFTQKLKKTLLLFFSIALCLCIFTYVKMDKKVLAQNIETGLSYVEQTGLVATDPRIIISNVIKIFLGFLGLISVILVMYAGFLWMTAGGDASKIEQSKKIMKNALIGLLIILSAYAIVSFIFRMLGVGGSNQNIPQSNIPSSSYFGVLGDNIIESHYPARGQKDVPRNTKIVITFREKMNVDTLINSATKKSGISICGGENENIICGDINYGNIKLYQSNEKDLCRGDAGKTDTSGKCVNAMRVQTLDNKIFTFRPASVLGNSSTYTDYTVYLGSGLKKENGQDAFALGDSYSWDFEVSNILDYTAPKIISVFPFADNHQDTYDVINAVAASWELTVAGLPSSGNPASATIRSNETETKLSGELSGEYSGKTNGAYYITINDPPITAQVSFNNADISNKDIINKAIDIGNGLKFVITDDAITAGKSAYVDVVAGKEADYLSIDSKKYYFGKEITMAQTNSTLVANIATALGADEKIKNTARSDKYTVFLEAEIAGVNSNGINIMSSDSTAITISKTEGLNATQGQKAKEILDVPINAIVQINFDEAVDPIAANNFIDIKDSENAKIAGELLFSNQYKTIEFKPVNSCGQNGCGENIYCLPAKNNIKISITAGTLVGCENCPDDFSACGGYGNKDSKTQVCQSTSLKNYPLATSNTGVVDMCDNSMDGNSNDNAEGPFAQSGKNSFSQNDLRASCAGAINNNRICALANGAAICNAIENCQYSDGSSVKDIATRLAGLQNIKGDDNFWSFFTSDILDLTAPVMSARAPVHGGTGVRADTPITATFNKLLMSSSLTTGSVLINNSAGTPVPHLRVNLSSSGINVGHWVEKEDIDTLPKDDMADITKVIIKHDNFGGKTLYNSDIGSGVKDIYQNCYNPSIGPKPCANEGTCP